MSHEAGSIGAEGCSGGCSGKGGGGGGGGSCSCVSGSSGAGGSGGIPTSTARAFMDVVAASTPLSATSKALRNAWGLLKAHEEALRDVCAALGVSSSNPAAAAAGGLAAVAALLAERVSYDSALVRLGVNGGLHGVDARVAAISLLGEGANAGARGGGAAPAPSLAAEFHSLSEAIGAELAACATQR